MASGFLSAAKGEPSAYSAEESFRWADMFNTWRRARKPGDHGDSRHTQQGHRPDK
jgi:hypothetical protein